MKFKRALSAVLAAVLACGALCMPVSAQDVLESDVLRAVVSAEYQIAANTALAAPSSNWGSGSYIVSSGFKVTLSGTSYLDEIWYSLNGTGYRRYTEPLNITQSSTVRTYLVRNGKMSSIAAYTYDLIPLTSTSMNSGTYRGVQRVFINCKTPGTKIYYTLDGSTPNERSSEYSSNGIVIGTSAVLKFVAVKSGWSRLIKTYNYTIIGGRDVSNDPNPDGGLVILNTAAAGKSESLLDNYTAKWGYNQLNISQKMAYARVFEAAKNHIVQVDLSGLDLKADDFEKAYWAFDCDNPQFLALGNGYGYYFYPSTGYLKSANIMYSRTSSEIANVQQMFDITAQNVVNIAKNQFDDYSKLKYIHDWIVNNTDYTLEGPAYKSEADGVVVYKRALCEGYAKAFMYLAQELGFECICVVGRANNTAHMWNMVKLNGAWYHVDATFDDPITSNGSKVLYHDYFLIGTSEISKTHTIKNYVSVPSAPRSYQK